MEVYFLSGLGADKTVFQFLNLDYCKPIFIDWIPPQKSESLPQYALRLKNEFIPDDAFLIGLSFGGMLAAEIAKQYPQIKTILISSSKTKNEIPGFYKIAKYLPLHHSFPGGGHKWLMMRMEKLFGLKNADSIKIYKELIKSSDPVFNRWAIDAIVNWSNTELPPNTIHIHGTHDHVLPYKNVKCNFTIKKGGHLMIMEQADIISQMLKDIITAQTFNKSVLSSSASRFDRLYQA